VAEQAGLTQQYVSLIEAGLERQREGIAKAKAEGKYKGRKPTARARAAEVNALKADGVRPVEIARRLGIGRASVYRVLAAWNSLGVVASRFSWPRSRWRNRCYRTSSRLDMAIGAEKPIPEEIDHREIAVPMAVVNEMELLLSSKPGKAAKPWSRNMILVVDIIMPAEWQRHYRKLNHEQIQSQKQIAESDNQDDRNQKEQRIIIPVIEIMSGNYVVSRIMDVMKLDMILEKSSAKSAMAEISMK
jgi:hypothetical protein